jgi:uncharacterized membrane protein YsdA (DUF1294 family)
MVGITIFTYIVFAIDKHKAKVKAQRISERELLTLSALGGFLGATLAMVTLHHKTSKTSFLLKHIMILLAWIGWLSYYFFDLNELNFLRDSFF